MMCCFIKKNSQQDRKRPIYETQVDFVPVDVSIIMVKNKRGPPRVAFGRSSAGPGAASQICFFDWAHQANPSFAMNIAIGHAQSEYTFHVELCAAFHVEARQLVHGAR
jgi:hypothetical protein